MYSRLWLREKCIKTFQIESVDTINVMGFMIRVEKMYYVIFTAFKT